MHSVVLSGPALLGGTFVPPGDKSISHRAVMFGALSHGKSSYANFLQAEDCLHTLAAFQAMGVPIRLDRKENRIEVEGVGLRGLKRPNGPLDLGNSGTSMRLLLGILAGQAFEATLTGDASLSSRPMRRVTDPLKKMGAQIKGRDHANFAPLVIRGGRLQGIEYENKWASAQVKSALLLAGLYADGSTRIAEPALSRDHTERFLQAACARFRREGQTLILEKTETLKPILFAEIPGDISAAAFFITAAAMIPGAQMTVEKVGLNPTRTGFLEVLTRMGALIETRLLQQEPEPSGTLHVKGARLRGTRIWREEIPSLIDELPALMTAMALAEGESLVSGAQELRVKETDRIHSMVTNLNAVGGRVEELPDGCLIRGVERFHGGKIQSFGDHRTAMSLAVATLAMQGEITIEDTDCVATSFPSFFEDFERFKKCK